MPSPRKRTRGRARRNPPGAASLRRDIAVLQRRLDRQESRLRAVAALAEDQARRGRAVADALRLGEHPRPGDRGVVRELQDSIVRLEDYLLKTGERIENILNALKQHREFLMNMNKRVLDVGTKDRIRLELDVMKNTLSILALNGIEFDGSLVKEIETLRKSIREEDIDTLERAKAHLDKHFDGELRKFDLDSIWSRKKEIPGYG